jgi:hypothetical protein
LILANAGEGKNVRVLPGVLERFPPEEVLWFGPRNASRIARDLMESFSDAVIEIRTAQRCQALELGEKPGCACSWRASAGAVFLLEWDRFRAILPLGPNFDDLEALHDGKDIGPVTALLLAEQGYAPANPPEWIANLHPQVVLLDVDAGARQDVPSEETLEILEGYTLLRTDQNGWIELSTDGENLWVEVEKR